VTQCIYLLHVVFVHVLVIRCTFVYVDKLFNVADIIFEVYIVVIFKMHIFD